MESPEKGIKGSLPGDLTETSERVRMNILLCNERFIFRYGVDRVLIMLGKGLKQRGHTIRIMTMRCDRPVLDTFADEVTLIRPKCDNYTELDEGTAQWLESEWAELFPREKPDVAVIAGWPFYESIRVFKNKGCITIFNDHGAVPLDGMSGNALEIQNRLRALRKCYLPQADQILGISDFIVNTQSLPDTKCLVPVRTVFNGVDHIVSNIWDANVAGQNDSTVVSQVHKLKQAGKSIILNLGRWEPGCYKNSEEAFTVTSLMRESVPDACLVVLGSPEELHVPEDLREAVLPAGFCDDATLRRLMELADIGISVSNWEGFNLPLGEMQWLGNRVLVFNIGAHPEVIVHPWYLCADNREMAQKGILLLKRQGGLDIETQQNALAGFRRRFSWDQAVDLYQQHFVAAAIRHHGGLRIVIDVTNATRDPANSGVIRVTRMICRTMQAYLDPIFVVWDDASGRYVFPTEEEYGQLGEFNGPKRTASAAVSPAGDRIPLTETLENSLLLSTWILLTETVMERRGHLIRKFAREHGLSTASVFYDAIPVLHPELCKDPIIRENHGAYMRGLAAVDVVFPISRFSADSLQEFWEKEQLAGGAVLPVQIAGDFSGIRPRAEAFRIAEAFGTHETNETRMLCVSTLEPRKNHKGLLEACLALQRKDPDLNWSLTLVGNRSAGAPEIPEYVERIAAENPRVKWLGIVDDAMLDKLYRDATFTVYPSFIEGFGLPIIESIFYGKPCITYEQGVMAELAKDGGCYTTDIKDVDRFSDALHRMITDRELRESLAHQAQHRTVKTWNNYCGQVLGHLLRHTPEIKPNAAGGIPEDRPSPAWTDILYPDCLIDNWQMAESERLALTAVLSRHRPKCSIELGTCRGSSLSLLAQYSTAVFSIDIDPAIPERYSFISNASFFTGPSDILLPLLIHELDAQDIPIDFILINADHSSEGVRRDLDIVLSYTPRSPLFVLMHNSFNPECRAGMLAARLQESPYVAWVDLDFIPGRSVEHGGGGDGELWGGLALVYLTPTPRKGPLQIHQSAAKIHRAVKEARIIKQ